VTSESFIEPVKGLLDRRKVH